MRNYPTSQRMRRFGIATGALAALWATLGGSLAWAQSFRRAGAEFNALREVVVPPDEQYSVVVVEFFHHGEIQADGKNVVVSSRDRNVVPSRVLQLGPGDYCRLAFQTAARQSFYEVLYGGEGPDEGEIPPWTDTDGLILETRQYRDCNLNDFESVRRAFESSERIGSDYVDNVQHSHNPFSLSPAPFLSRYSGQLHVGSAGTYGFLTSSQDCSFLLIDGKVVVDAPGRHGPLRRATRGTRKDVQLSAGAHKFEYYHAAVGPAAMMVAAWEISPADSKPKPSPIPPEAFRTASIGRAATRPVTTREIKLVPDFLVKIVGDVPLPDNDSPLVGVRFLNASPTALTLKSRARWEFGDGQTSEAPDPAHVYLRPGTYPVKLSVRRGTRTLEMTNRVLIDRPKIVKQDEFRSLDEYLPILATYDPKTLDAAALGQLVLAYQFKAETILASAESAPADPEQPEAKPDPKAVRQELESRRAEARKYLEAAVTAGQTAFTGPSAATGDEDLIKLARLVGGMARSDLGDSATAARIWQGAGQRIVNAELKAECEIEEADVAVSDLLDHEAAKPLLEAATRRLRPDATGPVPSRLHRVWGDYHAAAGDGEAARESYVKAEKVLGSTRSHLEQTAWLGAHSRSTEQFLRTNELDRAAKQLEAWQDEFPAEKIGGYLNLMFAHYWAARGMYDHPAAISNAQLAVFADSPYIDQLLVLAAKCDVKSGKVDRALATLRDLLENYPGSPLVPEVRETIAGLEAGEDSGNGAKPRSKTRGGEG
ncbi:MAG: PKD domain-containing protein [Planctomycetota bacterium]|jgi:tetratricopeptide (TPR) repeat protein